MAYPTPHVADNPSKQIHFQMRHVELLHVLAQGLYGKSDVRRTISWHGCTILADALPSLRHVCQWFSAL